MGLSPLREIYLTLSARPSKSSSFPTQIVTPQEMARVRDLLDQLSWRGRLSARDNFRRVSTISWSWAASSRQLRQMQRGIRLSFRPASLLAGIGSYLFLVPFS